MKLELDTDRMIAEVKDGIGWVIYNNPKRLNAVSLEMTEALPVIYDAYEERDDVRVVVLRGAGERAFVSGADISEFEKNRSSEESRQPGSRHSPSPSSPWSGVIASAAA